MKRTKDIVANYLEENHQDKLRAAARKIEKDSAMKRIADANAQAKKKELKEVSQKKAIKAYVSASDLDHDKTDTILARIKNKFGEKGQQNAERSAVASYLGRPGKSVPIFDPLQHRAAGVSRKTHDAIMWAMKNKIGVPKKKLKEASVISPKILKQYVKRAAIQSDLAHQFTTGSSVEHPVNMDLEKKADKRQRGLTLAARRMKKQKLDEINITNKQVADVANKADKALDKAYGYGTVKGGISPIPGRNRQKGFGAVANANSAREGLIAAMRGGNTKAVSTAVHRGWGKTVSQLPAPDEKKQSQRMKLKNTPFFQLSKDEKEKDDVISNVIQKSIKRRKLREEETLEEAKENTFDSYGKKVKALVQKYSAHNKEDDFSPSAPNTQSFRARHSGKIEYYNSHETSSKYGPTKTFYHVVHLGSNYPADKAKEFLDKYKKIKLPPHVEVSGDKHSVIADSKEGTNYDMHGITIGGKLKTLEEMKEKTLKSYIQKAEKQLFQGKVKNPHKEYERQLGVDRASERLETGKFGQRRMDMKLDPENPNKGKIVTFVRKYHFKEAKQGHALVADNKIVARGTKKQLIQIAKEKHGGISHDKGVHLAYTGKEVGEKWNTEKLDEGALSKAAGVMGGLAGAALAAKYVNPHVTSGLKAVADWAMPAAKQAAAHGSDVMGHIKNAVTSVNDAAREHGAGAAARELWNQGVGATKSVLGKVASGTIDAAKETVVKPLTKAAFEVGSAPAVGYAAGSGAAKAGAEKVGGAIKKAAWNATKKVAGWAGGKIKSAAGSVADAFKTKYREMKTKQLELPLPKPKPKVMKEEVEYLLEKTRIKIVRLRIRNGQVQRRKKVANVPGYTMRGGKLKRMSATERRRRRMGQKRGKIKRRAKLMRTLQKRKRSLQKRQRYGA